MGDVETAVRNMIGSMDVAAQVKLSLDGVFDDTGLPLKRYN